MYVNGPSSVKQVRLKMCVLCKKTVILNLEESAGWTLLFCCFMRDVQN